MEGVTLSDASLRDRAQIIGDSVNSRSDSSFPKKRKHKGKSQSESDKNDKSSSENKSRDPPKKHNPGACDSCTDKRFTIVGLNAVMTEMVKDASIRILSSLPWRRSSRLEVR